MDPTVNNGDTPLHWAAANGHVEICRLSLQKVERKNPANNNGDTPLHCAARHGRLDVCKLFIGNLNN